MKKIEKKLLPIALSITLIAGGSSLTASAAESGYAKGDVNGDGKITTADVGLTNAYVRGTAQLNQTQKLAADITGDGKISTADVGKINSIVRNNGAVSAPSSVKITNTSATAVSVSLSWSKVSCSGYTVYYSTDCQNWQTATTLNSSSQNSYTVSNLRSGTTYYFKVQAFNKSSAGALIYGVGEVSKASTNVKTVTPSMPEIIGAFYCDTDTISFYWDIADYADGYYVYRKNGSNWTQIAEIKNGYETQYTDTSLTPGTEYEYRVQSYAISGTQKKVSVISPSKKFSTQIKGNGFTYEPSPSIGIERLNSAKTTKADNTYTLYNRQGKKTTTSKYTLSDADIKTLKKFADKHFTSNMTKGQKVDYTLKWINRCVTYAEGDAYNKIAGKSFVDAVFNYKSGQCIQYNGALVAMMNYLGYDANLVQGYRGTEGGNQWQHFWGEVKIGNTSYLMEAGNYGEDGDWSFCCVTYKESNPWGGASYIMNGKAAEK